jgi:hypothetical protein
VQGGNIVESMYSMQYSMQSAIEIALKNSMLVSSLKVQGKSPRFFYLDPDINRVLGKSLFRNFRDVSF